MRNHLGPSEFQNPPRQKLSTSFIYSMSDSLKSISDCTTDIYSAQILEEGTELQAHEILEVGRKVNAPFHNASIMINPNAKKSKVLLVETSSRVMEFEPKKLSEAEQLAEIQRKTERLVIRQRQQRRQLKALKGCLQARMEEIERRRKQHELQASKLKGEIAHLANQNTLVQNQKGWLARTITQLQAQLSSNRMELANCMRQAQLLTQKIELLEANFEPFQHNRDHLESLPSLEYQIQGISHMIEEKKKKGEETQIRELLELKLKLVERRQQSKIEEITNNYQGKLTKLNQIILDRNRQQHDNQPAKWTQDQKGDEYLETSDTFFKADSNLAENQIDPTLEESTSDLSEKISMAIQQHVLLGHEETYKALQRIGVGLVQILKRPTFQEEAVDLVELTLKALNCRIVEKAKQKLHRIQKACGLQTGAQNRVK